MAQFCHVLIRTTAKEMAGAFYEVAASQDPQFYRMYPKQMRFINREWGRFVPLARAALAKMLAGNYPESTKEEIFEALCADRTLPKGDHSISSPQMVN